MMGLFEFLVTLFHPARLIRLLVLLVFLHLSLFSIGVLSTLYHYLVFMLCFLFISSMILLYNAWSGMLVFRKILKERNRLDYFDKRILAMNGLSIFPFVFFRKKRIIDWLSSLGVLDLLPLVMYIRSRIFDAIVLVYVYVAYFILFVIVNVLK